MSVPHCPVCERTDDVTRIDHPTGVWECGACRQVFDGGGQEALDLAQRRAAHHYRRDNPTPPLRLIRSTKETG